MQYYINASGCYYLNGTQFIQRGYPIGTYNFCNIDWTLIISAVCIVFVGYIIIWHLCHH